MQVKRYVRWYDADADRLVGEAEIDASLPRFQALVGAAPDDLMYDCRPVSPSVVAQLMVTVPSGSQLKFFLEADGVPDEP